MKNFRFVSYAIFSLALFAISGCSNKGTNGDSAPAAPSGLIGEGASSTAIRLSWVDNSDNEYGFAIYRSQFGVFELVRTASANEVMFTDIGLEDSVEYGYYVVATNGRGDSEASNIVAVSTAHSASAPRAPESPVPADSATRQGVNARLSWQCQDPDNENLLFDIYLGKEFPPALAHSQDSMTYVPLSTLDGLALYYWRVVAIDESQNRKSGPIWRFATAGVGNQPPDVPSGPSPADGAQNVGANAQLSWQCWDPDGDTLNFDVYFGAENPPPLVTNQESRTYDPAGDLTFETTYYWRIIAKDHNQNQTAGPLWSFTTAGPGNQPPDAPNTPSPADGATGIAINASLGWLCTDPTNDPLTYDVYFGAETEPALVSSNQSGNTYAPGTLANNTVYYWKIVAKDPQQNQTVGPVWSFTTEAGNQPPGAPTNPWPPDGENNVPIDAQASWSASDPEGDSLNFDVYFGLSNPPPFVGNQTAATYDPPGNLNNTSTYYWRVNVKDNRGNSTQGPVWRFTTAGVGNQPPSGPFNASPENGALNVAPGVVLSWDATDSEGDPLSFDVRFGTSDPPPLVGNQTARTYDPPGDLGNGVAYYWQIVVKDPTHETVGPVWGFTTAGADNGAPSAPGSPSPADGATGVARSASVTWQATDPDGDPLTYDVHFGTANPPPFVLNQQVAAFDPAGDLAENTTYHWMIIVYDDHGHATPGPVWGFTTSGPDNRPPDAPSNPNPSDGRTEVDLNADLAWQASDPDGDQLTYDIYFGTGAEPPLVRSDHRDDSFDPGMFAPITVYYWRIVAKDPLGGQTSGPIWFFTTEQGNQPPSAPFDPNPLDGRSGVDIDDRLEWRATDPDGDPLNYDVYFGTSNPPPFVQNQDSRRYNPPGGMDEGQSYYWQIAVHDDHGNQTAGPVWSFTTEEGQANLPPLPPSGPSPGSGDTDIGVDVTLSWQGSDPNGDTLTYDVFFGTSDVPPFAGSQAASSYDPPGDLLNGTTYYWMIVARDSIFQVPGPLWSFTTAVGNQAPGIPTDPTPPNLADNVDVTTVLSWQSTDPDGDPLSFDVYFGTINPPPFVLNQPVPSFDPSGDMANGTIYYWNVVAHDNQGHSTAGPVWSFTTAAPVNNPPNPPGNPSPSDGTSGVAANVMLFWESSDPDGDPITFDVYFGDLNPPPFVQNQSGNTFDPAGDLAGSTVYYWQIVVRDQIAQTPGPVWSFTTAAPVNRPPNPPTGPSPEDGAILVSPGIILSWQASDPENDPLTFDVYFGETNPPPFIQNQIDSSFDPPGDLNAFTTYFWEIIAHDAESQTAGPVWSFSTGLLAH